MSLFPASVPPGIVQSPVEFCSDQRRAVLDPVEGCLALPVPCARIGPGVEKRPDGRRMAFRDRQVQRGVAILGPRALIGPGGEKRPDGLHMAP